MDEKEASRYPWDSDLEPLLKKQHLSWPWWCVSLTPALSRTVVPALGRQRQVELCMFKASLVYMVSFRTVRGTQ